MTCTHICANPSSPRRATLNCSVNTQSLLRKAQPQFAEVLPAGEHLVRLYDRIARIKETRTTLLQLHAVQHKLHNERISVFRDEWLWYVRGGELWYTVEITEGNGAIFERRRWEKRFNEAVLRNQTLGNNPKHLCPDFTDSVNPPVLGLIERLVRRRIDRIVLRSGQQWI